jgi:hypothetical protein
MKTRHIRRQPRPPYMSMRAGEMAYLYFDVSARERQWVAYGAGELWVPPDVTSAADYIARVESGLERQILTRPRRTP